MSNQQLINAVKQKFNENHQHLKQIKFSVNNEYQHHTLTDTTNLNIYGGVSGKIDMDGYNHLTIKVSCSGMTSGISPAQNLKLYYSMDDITYVLGEVISTNEVPGDPGRYAGMIRVENVGFRFVKLFAVGVSAMLSGSVYTIQFTRR